MGNIRKANGHKRREVTRRVKQEETNCAICRKPVDLTLTFVPSRHGPSCRRSDCPGCVPHPMRAEVDEKVPVSRGGSPTERSNCQLTHRRCNREKGARLPTDEQPVLTFPVSRLW
jgi:5-methylcytosine-specific restriction endonuclease McrA